MEEKEIIRLVKGIGTEVRILRQKVEKERQEINKLKRRVKNLIREE